MSDWKTIPKKRRAAVYRAFGRAIRIAREDKESELASDMRAAFDTLKGAHTKGGNRRRRSAAGKRR